MSEIYEIADAVTAAINATPLVASGPWPTFTAQRQYVVVDEMTALDELQVVVVPLADKVEQVSRDIRTEDVSVRVGVLQHLAGSAGDPSTPAGNAAVDPLVQLSRAISLVFQPGMQAGDAIWRQTLYGPVFDYGRLKTNRVFLSQITFTFKQAA